MLRRMKTLLVAVVFALSWSLSAGAAEKARELPYAAGNPSGGVPLWNPGDQFIAVSAGSCPGTCPVYDLYLFSTGKVVFSGRKFTAKLGVFEKQISPEIYASLLTLLVNTDVMDKKIKRGSCLSGHPMLSIMRSTP